MATDTTAAQEPTTEPLQGKTPEDPQPAPEELEAATQAAAEKQATIVEDLYKHIRHTLGAEISIGQAEQIVEMVQTATAAE